MPIKFRCQHCHQLLGISQSKAGESVDCPTCGRTVRVPTLDGKSSPAPAPKMNLQDSSLLHALDALAGLGQGPGEKQKLVVAEADDEKLQDLTSIEPIELGREASASEDDREGKKARELLPLPLPEPVELPPLEQPIALDEPVSPIQRPAANALNQVSTSTSVPKDPLIELAALTNRPAPSTSHDPVNVSPQNSLGVLVLVSCLSFLAGFLVHAQFFAKDSTPSETNPKSAEIGEDKPGKMDQTELRTTDVSRERAVEGRITYRTSEGNSKPDVGATVILLPVSRSSSAKLPIIGFRPADHQEDRNIARASVRALGGDVCQVDDDGRFAAELEQPGNYHVFVLSHFQQRPDEDVRLLESVKAVLAEYFDRPEQLPGRRRYHLGYVYYRGEETEIWDYSFERI